MTGKVRESVRYSIISLIEQEGGPTAFARKVGATPQNVRNWVAGDSCPSIEKLGEIAEVYDVPVGSLMGDRGDVTLPPDEDELLGLYRSMSGQGKAMLLQVARSFVASGAYDA